MYSMGSRYPSECARATAVGESRFRIDVPIAPARAARVIALDAGAAAATRRVASLTWFNARFYTCADGSQTEPAFQIGLHGLGGAPAALTDVLAGADVVVVIAMQDTGEAQAAAIGRACSAAGITTAGVVLGDGSQANDAVAALRPHARVLLLSADESDVSELLTALRV